MSFLVRDDIIQRVGGGSQGKRHYRVEFELVMIIHGRSLRYEARWPIGEGGQVRAGGQICIAAAFLPGTE
jgi:hypothetical protein